MAHERPHFYQPQNNGVPPPERGGLRFRVTAPTRPNRGRTSTIPRPTETPSPVRTKDDPTIKEADVANAGGYAGQTRTVENVGGNRILRTVLGGGALIAGGATLYETVPAVHRAVDSAFLDHLRGKSLSPSEASTIDPKEIFDNNATKGVVGPNTILYVPREEFNKTPIADAQGNPIFDFPWDNNHPTEMQFHYNVVGDRGIAWLKSNGLTNAEEYRGYKSEQYSDNKLPVGYELSTIHSGRLFFMGSVYNEEASRKSPSNPYGLAIYDGPIIMAQLYFIAPNGILNHLNFEVVDNSGGVEKSLPILPLVDAPYTNPIEWSWEKGLPIERLQKIFSTTKEGKLKITIGGFKDGKTDGPVQGNIIPGNLTYNTGTDAAGTPKVLVSDSK